LERHPEPRVSSPISSSTHASVDPLTSQLLLIQLSQQRQIMSMLEKQMRDSESLSPRHSASASARAPVENLSSLPSPRSLLAVEPFEHQDAKSLSSPTTYLSSTMVPVHAPPTGLAGRKAKKTNRGIKVHKSNEAGMLLDPKGHPALQSAASLQIAIRCCTERAQRAAVDDGALSYDKYVEFDKVLFPSAGSPTTPPHVHPSFKIKDYCPAVFKELRSLFGITEADYLGSLCQTDPHNPSIPSLRVMGSPGKSGSMFFFSCDMRFIVKTIPKLECKQLRDLLPSSAPPSAPLSSSPHPPAATTTTSSPTKARCSPIFWACIVTKAYSARRTCASSS
jgi:hypothetical protein